jgi:hypothetical protein
VLHAAVQVQDGAGAAERIILSFCCICCLFIQFLGQFVRGMMVFVCLMTGQYGGEYVVAAVEQFVANSVSSSSFYASSVSSSSSMH